jgi:hypothetical protein
MSNMIIKGEGEEPPRYRIYVLGFDQYGNPDYPVQKVAEFQTDGGASDFLAESGSKICRVRQTKTASVPRLLGTGAQVGGRGGQAQWTRRRPRLISAEASRSAD